jgi:hypothetical protein
LKRKRKTALLVAAVVNLNKNLNLKKVVPRMIWVKSLYLKMVNSNSASLSLTRWPEKRLKKQKDAGYEKRLKLRPKQKKRPKKLKD